MKKQPFYRPPRNLGEDNIQNDDWVSYEQTVIFYLTNFQFLACAISFSTSKPYREPMYKNYPLFFTIVAAYILGVAFLWIPPAGQFMFSVFEDVPFCAWTCDYSVVPPVCDPREPIQPCYPSYGWFILLFAFVDSVITYIVEVVLIR